MHPLRCRRALAGLFASVALLTTAAVRAESQQNVLDRFQFHELQSRYALAHDLTDPAGAKDGERSFGALRHVITNSVIELTGGSAATGVCYVLTVVNRPERGPEILSVGRYEDEYRKVDGAWLIAKRTIVMDMGNSELGKATGLFGE